MQWNALEKSTNNNVALKFFAWSPSMIRWLVRISDVEDFFSPKTVLIYPKNIFDFRFDAIAKQSIINLSRYRSKNYVYVVLGDSEITCLRKEEDEAFCSYLYCILFINNSCKIEVSKSSNFLVFHTSRGISSRLLTVISHEVSHTHTHTHIHIYIYVCVGGVYIYIYMQTQYIYIYIYCNSLWLSQSHLVC